MLLDENGVVTDIAARKTKEVVSMAEEEFWRREYICPICLNRKVLCEPAPRCCGHYMVEFEVWEKDKEAWLRSRKYTLELEDEVRSMQEGQIRRRQKDEHKAIHC